MNILPSKTISYYFKSLDLSPNAPEAPSSYTDSLSHFFSSIQSFFSRTPSPPLNVQAQSLKDFTLQNRRVVMGDVHGELFGLLENLTHAGLINEKGQWIAGNQTLVQLGDVIDRGFFSLVCWNFLGQLQEKARAEGGDVIRLIGNHELMVLENHLENARRYLASPEEFRKTLVDDILKKRVQLAHTDGKRLFVHAGLRSSIRTLLIREIIEKKANGQDKVSLKELTDHLNEKLIEAIENNDFNHPIFQVSYYRGGPCNEGGALWADQDELLLSNHARDLPQIIGHNVPRREGDFPIRITTSHNLILADAGMNIFAGGRRAYVVLDQEKGQDHLLIRIKQANEKWVELITEDHAAIRAH